MVMQPNFAADAPGGVTVRAAADIQRLWFTLSKRPWTFLVIMPAHARGDATELARRLAEVGTQHRGTTVRCLLAVNVEVSETSHVIVEAIAQNPLEGATIVAVDSPLLNPASIPIALAADGVLLLVTLGETDISAAKQTVEAIGKDRFFGTVTLAPDLGT